MWIREAGYQDNMVGSNGFKEKNKFNTVSCKICKKFKISNSFERIEKDEDIIIKESSLSLLNGINGAKIVFEDFSKMIILNHGSSELIFRGINF